MILEKFWVKYSPIYPKLGEEALRLLIPFSSYNICEVGFSALVVLKTKQRIRLLVESDLCCALSFLRPRITDLVKKKATTSIPLITKTISAVTSLSRISLRETLDLLSLDSVMSFLLYIFFFCGCMSMNMYRLLLPSKGFMLVVLMPYQVMIYLFSFMCTRHGCIYSWGSKNDQMKL